MFKRGDGCNASIYHDEVVGYNFSSFHPRLVTNGIEFRFPEDYVYSYASKTARSHRGKRLTTREESRVAYGLVKGCAELSLFWIGVAGEM